MEANRALMTKLDSSSLAELLQEATGGEGVFSIGSTADPGLTSFANKETTTEGSAASPADVGYTCRKGLKPTSPNQDSWAVLEVAQNFAIYGVFDGHGQAGHDISDYVRKTLLKLILRDQRFQSWMKAEPGTSERSLEPLEQLVKECFVQAQGLVSAAHAMKTFDAQLAGTTATLCIFDHKAKKYLVAHVADSICVLGKQGNKGESLTQEHKPDVPDERARIEDAGGQVVFDGYANYRIFAQTGLAPGINMSRCLGDLFGHSECGLTAEPEVTVRELQAEDSVLLLCSDGVWEFIDPAKAASIAMESYKKGGASKAAESLAKEAWDRWIKEEEGAVVDDITAICVFLNTKSPEGESSS
jgi:serine/threonine protein phosphatase PrpC